MGDYTQTESFWKRLLSFVSDVQTGCAMGEEEKEMIIRQCEEKLKTFKSEEDESQEQQSGVRLY
jgi:hypothetical protein